MFCAARLKSETIKSSSRVLMPPQDLLLPMSEKHFFLPRPKHSHLALMLPVLILVVGIAFTVYYFGYRDIYAVQAIDYYSELNE